MSIGDRIKIALDNAGKNQAQLARFLETKQSTVGGWISAGRIPNANVIDPICEFTNVSHAWLLTGNEVKAETTYEAALLGAFRALPPAGREVALKQILSLGEVFPAGDGV